jgi:hypothetical protein
VSENENLETLTAEQARVLRAAVAYIEGTWTDDHPLEVELREAVAELTHHG